MEQETQVVKFDASNAVVEYSITDAMLEELEVKYSGEVSIVEKEDYESCKIAQGELRQLRVDVEARRKELKSDSLAWGRKVDEEAKRITGRLLAMETPMKDARKLVDDKKAAKAREKREKEEKRIADIKGKIQALTELGDVPLSADVATINANIHLASGWLITKDDYAEFEPGAQLARDGVIDSLQEKLDARQAYDKDQADLAEQREEQERVAKEQEKTAQKQREEQEAIDKRKRDASAAEQKVKDEETERLRKESEARKAEEAQQAADALEAAQAPDRDKIEKYLAELVALPVPALNDPAMIKVMVQISVNLTAFREQAIKAVDAA